MGGVRASLCWPPTIVKSRQALPRALLSDSTTLEPSCLSDPVIMPLWASRVRPSGRFLAAKVIGFSPVAGMRTETRGPGVLPTIRGP